MLLPKDIEGKRIVYACFDWGLGHLTRSIPLLLQLEGQGNEIFFLGSDTQITLLQEYGFKGKTELLDGSNLKFSGSGNFVLEGIRNLLKGPRFIRNDKAALKQLLKSFAADYIISDHRYGFSNKNVHSIFLTHQVQLPEDTPRLVSSLHRNWLMDFKTIWILDTAEQRLAGNLSDCPENGVYIGWYSRFMQLAQPLKTDKGLVGIVSGPEPYSDQLFQLFEKVATTLNCKMTIVCAEHFQTNVPNISLVHDFQEADSFIAGAELILSRNGYSTLMDLAFLQKKALLIATTGQSEQLYLAEHSKMDHVNMFSDENTFILAVENALKS